MKMKVLIVVGKRIYVKDWDANTCKLSEVQTAFEETAIEAIEILEVVS